MARLLAEGCLVEADVVAVNWLTLIEVAAECGAVESIDKVTIGNFAAEHSPMAAAQMHLSSRMCGGRIWTQRGNMDPKCEYVRRAGILVRPYTL
jgi:hypothetical protein